MADKPKKPMTPNQIGALLYDRVQRTRPKVAKMLGISPKRLIELERGVSAPTPDEERKIRLLADKDENDAEARRRGLSTSDEVQKIREAKGLSRKRLAAYLGCSVQEIEAIEEGYALLSLQQNRDLKNL